MRCLSFCFGLSDVVVAIVVVVVVGGGGDGDGGGRDGAHVCAAHPTVTTWIEREVLVFDDSFRHDVCVLTTLLGLACAALALLLSCFRLVSVCAIDGFCFLASILFQCACCSQVEHVRQRPRRNSGGVCSPCDSRARGDDRSRDDGDQSGGQSLIPSPPCCAKYCAARHGARFTVR